MMKVIKMTKTIKMTKMMKTIKTMTMRNCILNLLIIFCLGIIIIPNVTADDTGTYQIQKYNVVLTPHYNGDITIAIDQKWLVTGGHIPWVTVGLPNSNYEVQNYGGDAQSVSPDNGGGWDGVRVDLVKDFQPQETFEFNFSINQHGLLEKSGDGYRLGYTPGWYDRAFTDELTVKLVSPAKIEELKTDPQPNTVNGQDVIWTRNLGKGEKFTVSVQFPNGTYNQTAIEGSGGEIPGWVIIAFIVFVVMVGIGIAVSSGGSSSSDSSYYRSSYYGETAEERRRRRKKEKDDEDYTSPIIYSGASKGSHSSHSSGGGGGFGGRSTSCACACVSCACACACAGGGGAGCKKPRHFCPKCLPKNPIDPVRTK